jgi:DNA-binding transcriptional LysR family regulator
MRTRLEELARPYRIVVVARSMTGLRGAVASGLAVSVMMRSSVTGEMRELTAHDGFPPLAQLSIRLEKAHMKKSAVVDALEQALLAAVSEGLHESSW